MKFWYAFCGVRVRVPHILFSGGPYGSVFEQLANINNVINDFVWVKIGLVLLIGTGIIMTCCTKFFQVGHIAHWWKTTIGIGNMGQVNKITKNYVSRKIKGQDVAPMLSYDAEIEKEMSQGED